MNLFCNYTNSAISDIPVLEVKYLTNLTVLWHCSHLYSKKFVLSLPEAKRTMGTVTVLWRRKGNNVRAEKFKMHTARLIKVNH